MLFRDSLACWVACLLLPASGCAAAQDARALLQDCDRAAWQEVLQPHVGPVGARGIWLDRRTLQWPGITGVERVRLHHSAGGTIRAVVGEAVQGADGVMDLQASDADLAPALAQRFKHLAPGARWRLGDADAARLPGLLASQWVLVREGANGTVADATGLQSPGLLDDLFAAASTLPDLGVRLGGSPRHSRFTLWAPTARRVALCVYPGDTANASDAAWMQLDPATGAWRTWSTCSCPASASCATASPIRIRRQPHHRLAAQLHRRPRRSRVEAAGWDEAPRPPAGVQHRHGDLRTARARFLDRRRCQRAESRIAASTWPSPMPQRRHAPPARAGARPASPMSTCCRCSTSPRARIRLRDADDPAAAPDSDAQQAAVMAVAAKDCFNWGYDPFHFNAPEGSYASDAADGAVRIREFRAMVQALHAPACAWAWTWSTTTPPRPARPRSVLDRIVPGYYQRLDANGKVERSTCCDNTATEHR
jgi:pullulanase